ncbi:MAG: hypothetical protein ACJAQ2_000537, partial [Vicingaceae bacterium]
ELKAQKDHSKNHKINGVQAIFVSYSHGIKIQFLAKKTPSPKRGRSF